MKLLKKLEKSSGSLRSISEVYQDEPGKLRPEEHFVRKCILVGYAEDAVKVIREGVHNHWRFWLSDYPQLSLWAPPSVNPLTYTFRNEILWRTIAAIQKIGKEALL